MNNWLFSCNFSKGCYWIRLLPNLWNRGIHAIDRSIYTHVPFSIRHGHTKVWRIGNWEVKFLK